MQDKFDDQDYNPPFPPYPTARIPGSDPDPNDEDSGIVAVYRDRLALGFHWRHPLDPPLDCDYRRIARQLLGRHHNGEDRLGGFVAHNLVSDPRDEPDDVSAILEALADVAARHTKGRNA